MVLNGVKGNNKNNNNTSDTTNNNNRRNNSDVYKKKNDNQHNEKEYTDAILEFSSCIRYYNFEIIDEENIVFEVNEI